MEFFTEYWYLFAAAAVILVVVSLKQRKDKDKPKSSKPSKPKTDDNRAVGHWNWYTPDDRDVHFTFAVHKGGDVGYNTRGGPKGKWSMNVDNLVLHDVPDPAGNIRHADGSRRSRIELEPLQLINGQYTKLTTQLRGREVQMVRR